MCVQYSIYHDIQYLALQSERNQMSLRTCVSIAFVKMVCLPVRSSVGKVGRTALGRRERRGFRDTCLPDVSPPFFHFTIVFVLVLLPVPAFRVGIKEKKLPEYGKLESME